MQSRCALHKNHLLSSSFLIVLLLLSLLLLLSTRIPSDGLLYAIQVSVVVSLVCTCDVSHSLLIPFASVVDSHWSVHHHFALARSLCGVLLVRPRRPFPRSPSVVKYPSRCVGKQFQTLAGYHTHSERRFPAPSSKLCQIWLRH